MTPVSLHGYLVVGAILFVLGMIGFLARRNLIIMFLSAEMMLQGVAVNLVAFAHFRGNLQGQVLTLFILTVAACEAALALEVAAVAGEGDKVDGHALQHHLGAQEHDDQVAAGEEADQPQGEQDGADNQVVVDRYGVHERVSKTSWSDGPLLVGRAASLSRVAPGQAGSSSYGLRRPAWAMAMAPMVATSSSVPPSSTASK